jgi:hypothetical protein
MASVVMSTPTMMTVNLATECIVADAGFVMPLCVCGSSAVRTIGAISYCAGCAEALLTPIRRRVAQRDGIGFGEQVGRRRFDYGERYAELGCNVCGASWVGPIGEACIWCERRAERRARWRVEGARRATHERRRVAGVLRCETCGWLIRNGPLLEHAVCGVHGGPGQCDGRFQAVHR